MKPANDPHVDYVDIVRKSYNQCAKAYLEARVNQPPDALELLANKLPDNSKILDLGCGAGIPITKALASHHEVTGVDFSEEQIRLARVNVPDGIFLCKNITELNFPLSSYDAITAFYVLFHLPLKQQKDIIVHISDWLKLGGYFLATLSSNNEAPYTEDDFFGTTMYWNNLSVEEYRAVLEGAGFQILYTGTLGHGYTLDMPHMFELHPYVFAQKRYTPHKPLKQTP